MIISTRGRYALRFMIDLAETSGESYVALKTIAERQGISLKYLERILPVLAQSGMIEGIQGKGGGYVAARHPDRVRMLPICDPHELMDADTPEELARLLSIHQNATRKDNSHEL